MEFTRLVRYSRLKTLFRIILAIPIAIVRYVMGLLLEVGAVAAWIVIVITGTMPRGLFDMMVLANSYTARSDAYLWLLTETTLRSRTSRRALVIPERLEKRPDISFRRSRLLSERSTIHTVQVALRRCSF